MKKGQVVGGPGTATVPRGMLPPTGKGPIEVTRETLDEGADIEQEAKSEKASDAVEDRVNQYQLVSQDVNRALAADLPKADADPKEIIVACEKRLHAANTLLDAMQRKTTDIYFHHAAPAIQLAWSTESWRQVVDPSTNKLCRSWSAWLRIAKVSRQHAFRMTKERPIMEALEGLSVGKLGVRQIDALSPVLTNFGKKAVREVWTTAMGWGDTGAASLMKIRAQLGHEPNKVVSEGEDAGSDDDVPVLRFQTRAGVFDAARVREAVKTQPDIALLVAKEIFATLGIEQPA